MLYIYFKRNSENAVLKLTISVACKASGEKGTDAKMEVRFL